MMTLLSFRTWLKQTLNVKTMLDMSCKTITFNPFFLYLIVVYKLAFFRWHFGNKLFGWKQDGSTSDVKVVLGDWALALQGFGQVWLSGNR